MTPEQLNDKFGITGELEFFAGSGDLPMARVDNDNAAAVISLYAGQVLSYRPVDQREDLLFVSDAARFAAGKAIKGGIPLCWPWFGADPEDRGRAAHGFARNRFWEVRDTATGSGETRLLLALDCNGETREIWPGEFGLTLEIVIGPTLAVELVSRNTGSQPFEVTQALHSYFNVGAVEQVSVAGLDGRDYLDKAADGRRGRQSGPVTFSGEVDRIYTGVRYPLVVEDPVLERRIQLDAGGSRTAVVWNPWADIAARMDDLVDDDYQRFVCVETANAADEVVRLQPGEEHRLSTVFRIER